METKGPQPDHVYTAMTLPFDGGVLLALTIARKDSVHLNFEVYKMMLEAMHLHCPTPPPIIMLMDETLDDPDRIKAALDLVAERVPGSVAQRAEMKFFHYVIWLELEESPGAAPGNAHENASTALH